MSGILRDITTASENWAGAAHYNRTTGGYPTVSHLKDVVTLVSQYTRDEEIISAAWLHDTLKYTSTTKEEIARTLSRRVSQLVWLVTDGDGYSRTIRKAELYAKFLSERDPITRADAAFLKVCDRIVNMRDALRRQDSTKIRIYTDEFPEFIKVFGLNLLTPNASNSISRLPLWDELFGLFKSLAVANNFELV